MTYEHMYSINTQFQSAGMFQRAKHHHSSETPQQPAGTGDTQRSQAEVKSS